MMVRMSLSRLMPKRRAMKSVIASAVLFIVFLAPLIARAASDDEVYPDARLEGYSTSVFLKEGGIAGSVVVLVLLTAITMGVMFINAKRSHLD
jgi:hypothetical protein